MMLAKLSWQEGRMAEAAAGAAVPAADEAAGAGAGTKTFTVMHGLKRETRLRAI